MMFLIGGQAENPARRSFGLKDNLWVEGKLQGVEKESNSTVPLSEARQTLMGCKKQKRKP